MSCELFDTFHPIIVTPGWVCFGCALCAPGSGSLSGATHSTLRKEPNSADDICLFLINILTLWWVHIAHILKHTVTLFMEAHSSLCLIRNCEDWLGKESSAPRVTFFELFVAAPDYSSFFNQHKVTRFFVWILTYSISRESEFLRDNVFVVLFIN